MADMALRMIAAKSGEGVPINRAVARNLIGRRAVGRLPFAVLFLFIGLTDAGRGHEQGEKREYGEAKAKGLHKQPRGVSGGTTTRGSGGRPAEVGLPASNLRAA